MNKINLKEIILDDIEALVPSNSQNKEMIVKDFINTIVIRELFSLNLETLLFKGGTCLYKQLNDEMGRISEDLDFFISKEEYKKSKKKIKQLIDSFIEYTIFSKVELVEEESSSNKREWIIIYKDNELNSINDIGQVRIELVLTGGSPVTSIISKISSVIERSNNIQLSEQKIKMQEMNAIVIDKLFIFTTNDEKRKAKRITRDIYDIQRVITNNTSSIDWQQLIKDRIKRQTMPGSNQLDILENKDNVFKNIEKNKKLYFKERNNNELFLNETTIDFNNEYLVFTSTLEKFYQEYEILKRDK